MVADQRRRQGSGGERDIRVDGCHEVVLAQPRAAENLDGLGVPVEGERVRARNARDREPEPERVEQLGGGTQLAHGLVRVDEPAQRLDLAREELVDLAGQKNLLIHGLHAQGHRGEQLVVAAELRRQEGAGRAKQRRRPEVVPKAGEALRGGTHESERRYGGRNGDDSRVASARRRRSRTARSVDPQRLSGAGRGPGLLVGCYRLSRGRGGRRGGRHGGGRHG